MGGDIEYGIAITDYEFKKRTNLESVGEIVS